MGQSHVYVFYLEYTSRHRATGLPLLRDFVARLYPHRAVRLTIVDNARDAAAEVELERDVNLIRGDNRSREFSGLDVGIAWAQKHFQMPQDAPCVLANDTFHRSYGADYLNLFFAAGAAKAAAAGTFVGYVDAYPEAVELFGHRLQRWVRTSLMLLRHDVLSRLLPLAMPFEDSEIFSPSWQTFFLEPSPLSSNYRQFLRTWLFGESPAQGTFGDAWHSQSKLTAENFESFKGKTRSILCEHYLSARADRLGIPIVDVRPGG